MSKVKIQGHASGSGTLTIGAPNTDSDRTITLPDTTGTLLDENSSLPAANLTGTVADARISALTASKLTGALPAISGASLTDIVSQGRNLIINGGFDVWQRGTSLAGAASFLADRWFNATSGTQSRQTFTVGQTDVPHNPTYHYRQVTGSTEWYETRQKIENVAVTAGREVTLSYWMKGSSAFTNAPYRVQNFGSGGSSAVSAALSTASITTSWARYTHTFTFPSISGKTVGAGNSIQINLVRANVNNMTIDLANCQLEFGDTATDFEQRSYGEELALCQRYYENLTQTSNEFRHNGIAWSTDNINVPITFLVEKRAAPTISITSNGDVYNGAWVNATGSAVTGAGTRGCTVDIQKSSGYVVKYGYFIRGQVMTSDAEL